MTCPCECHKSQSWCCDSCDRVQMQITELQKRLAAIESSPMMQLKARCNRCGKEVDPASPAHLCLVPGGVIVNA